MCPIIRGIPYSAYIHEERYTIINIPQHLTPQRQPAYQCFHMQGFILAKGIIAFCKEKRKELNLTRNLQGFLSYF
jgi:hypothetical protein